MDRHLTIHGHFYQPPRENPWLEAVELQDSAYPYHDWNERITAECYGPNAAARILDDDGRIQAIVNNYARISFNFGPTLLSWMAHADPEVYAAVLEADRLSRERFSGHGSALAQAYNHLIMPLASERDKRTQVLWGIADFRHRFGRDPEGMWLPETAVDTATLEHLAEHGIRFTILEPGQAEAIRPLVPAAADGDGEGEGDDADGENDPPWQPVGDGGADPSRAYRCRLPSGRSIDLFFYDGPISRAIAFEQLLESGERFAGRLTSGFAPERDWPQLMHVATDGETYGHHHRHGEMALAYALDRIESEGLATLTNYGEFLERHPPEWQVEIREDTAWSCAHGIERWRSDCGCHTGGEPGWHQRWRAPLRDALDWLRDRLAPRYEEAAGEIFTDPWAARDAYVQVVLDRSPASLERFFAEQAGGWVDGERRVRALELLEMQRQAMLMYTSCGWFFNELSGIETVQVLQYAGRAVELAEKTLGESFEDEFLERLAAAESNLPEYGDGRRIYQQLVRPSRVGLAEAAAHYAISSLFEEHPEHAEVYCFRVDRDQALERRAGRAALSIGRVTVTSEITTAAEPMSYGVLHFGDHNLTGGVRAFRGDDPYRELSDQTVAAFESADFAQVVRLLDRAFGELTYSLRSLFRDRQRQVLDQVLATTLAEVEALYRQVYDAHAPLLRFIDSLGIPLPAPLAQAATVVLNRELSDAFAAIDRFDPERVRRAFEETADWQLELDAPGLGLALERTLDQLADVLAAAPAEPAALETLDAAVGVARELPFPVDLWQPQNALYRLTQTVWPERLAAAEAGEEDAAAWVDGFRALADKLGVRVE